MFAIAFCLLLKPYDDTCNKVRNGIFYFYAKNTNEKFKLIRSDTLQQEINLSKGDTSFWKINWLDNCAFSIKFLNTTKVMPQDEKVFRNSHIIVSRILKVSSEYYTYVAGLDSLNSKYTSTDTVWISLK